MLPQNRARVGELLIVCRRFVSGFFFFRRQLQDGFNVLRVLLQDAGDAAVRTRHVDKI